jgi:hypothetical protein
MSEPSTSAPPRAECGLDAPPVIRNLLLCAKKRCAKSRACSNRAGRVSILDTAHTAEYVSRLCESGLSEVDRSALRFRIFPPVRLVTASKPGSFWRERRKILDFGFRFAISGFRF